MSVGSSIGIEKVSNQIENKNSEGSITRYVYGSSLIASIKGGDITYYHSDRINSNRIITDSDGLIESEFNSLPFGQEIKNSGIKFSFATGKELDESKLYYFGARYYDSNLGKFTSIDPIEKNYPYIYTHNNPMNLIDPDGAAVGDPIGDGKVENLFGSPVSQGTYDRWSESRTAYDRVEANPDLISKASLWLHPDFDNFEDWHNSILATSYPQMYYNPNRGGGLDWKGMSGLEKTLLVANTAIYLVTVFGGPRAMAMQNRQVNPIRPVIAPRTATLTDRDASSPARSNAAREGLARSYRAGTSIFQQQGYWRVMSHQFSSSTGREFKLSPHAAYRAIQRQIGIEKIQAALNTKPTFERYEGGSYYLFKGPDVSVSVNTLGHERSQFIRTIFWNE